MVKYEAKNVGHNSGALDFTNAHYKRSSMTPMIKVLMVAASGCEGESKRINRTVLFTISLPVLIFNNYQVRLM